MLSFYFFFFLCLRFESFPLASIMTILQCVQWWISNQSFSVVFTINAIWFHIVIVFFPSFFSHSIHIVLCFVFVHYYFEIAVIAVFAATSSHQSISVNALAIASENNINDPNFYCITNGINVYSFSDDSSIHLIYCICKCRTIHRNRRKINRCRKSICAFSAHLLLNLNLSKLDAERQIVSNVKLLIL